MIFRGVGTALATPFKKDLTVDYEAYERLIDYQLEGGVDALIACGTTAEASTLSEEEKIKLIKLTIDKSQGNLPVIVGTGTNDTHKTIEFSKKVSQIDGVDGLLVVTPYYNKATSEGLYLHFKSLAEAVSSPIILYNVPSRTNVNIDPHTVARLAEIENIVGIKDATADLHYTSKVKSLVDENFGIYSGNDDLIAPVLSVGGHGVISVLSNVLPRECKAMLDAYFAKDYEKLAAEQVKYLNFIEALFAEVNPVPVKAALSILGICQPYMRLPLTPATEITTSRLKEELEKIL